MLSVARPDRQRYGNTLANAENLFWEQSVRLMAQPISRKSSRRTHQRRDYQKIVDDKAAEEPNFSSQSWQDAKYHHNQKTPCSDVYYWVFSVAFEPRAHRCCMQKKFNVKEKRGLYWRSSEVAYILYFNKLHLRFCPCSLQVSSQSFISGLRCLLQQAIRTQLRTESSMERVPCNWCVPRGHDPSISPDLLSTSQGSAETSCQASRSRCGSLQEQIKAGFF
jgi:hypothetical protein